MQSIGPADAEHGPIGAYESTRWFNDCWKQPSNAHQEKPQASYSSPAFSICLP